MNEYIVWDKFAGGFSDSSMRDKTSGKVHRLDLGDRFTKHDFIKTDIDGNKIYADCSIVEFGYTSGKSIGHFTYNKDRLAYDIVDKRGGSLNYAYNFRQIHSLKVIGTLQENPELLGEAE